MSNIKIANWLFISFTLLGALFYLYKIGLFSELTEEKIEKGQVWVMEIKNPFESRVIEYKVLDYKDNYVKYVILPYENSPKIQSERYFRIGTKFKKRVE